MRTVWTRGAYPTSGSVALSVVTACQAMARLAEPGDGPVSFDFLGYTFRPRDTMGKNGRFTGFDPAASPKAVKRMSKIVSGWQLRRLTNLTWEQLTGLIGPVIRGWMAYYGRFRRSGLHPRLARINYHVQERIKASTGGSGITGP